MIILSASLISFPMFLAEILRDARHNEHIREKHAFWSATAYSLNNLSANFKLNTGRLHNKFMKGNEISLIGPKQLYSNLVLIWFLLCGICGYKMYLRVEHILWQNYK